MSTSNRHMLRLGLTVFVAALAVRLVFCFVLIDRLDLNIGPKSSDFHEMTDGYTDLAVTLADHGRFAFAPDAPPTTYRAPVFPVLLAGAYRVLGDIGLSVLLVNCLASAATCVLLWWLAVRTLGHRAAWAMAVWPIVFPLSVFYCARSYSDTLFALAVAVTLTALYRMSTSPSARTALVVGLAVGVTCLTKAVLLLFPLALIAYAAIARRSLLKLSIITALAAYAVVGLWSARNAHVANRWIPVCGGTGFNLAVGGYMIEKGGDPGTSYLYAEAKALTRVNQANGWALTRQDLRTGPHLDLTPDLDQAFARVAMDAIAADPVSLIRKIAINLTRFWTFSSSPTKFWVSLICNVGTAILGLTALIRLVRLGHDWAGLWLLVFIYLVALYAVVIVHSSRFCLPVVLPLAPLAVAQLLGYLPRRTPPDTESKPS